MATFTAAQLKDTQLARIFLQRKGKIQLKCNEFYRSAFVFCFYVK